MLRSLTFLTALSVAAAAPSRPATSKYDYIVVGGGTSGLVVANRLSENPDVSVLVIEAGDSVLNDPTVLDVDGYGLSFGSELDWQYESVNQTFAGNTRQVLRAGKALSGTSAINGMAYTRAEDVQIDAWEAIGNDGWSWKTLLPYYLKSENLTLPGKAQLASGATYIDAYNGHKGPLQVGFPDIPANNLTTILNQTHHNLGVPWTRDFNGGKMRGFSTFPSTIDYANYVREDAARAYYWPYKSRSNLRVLLNTFANRIVWGEDRDGQVSASGVEITSRNGTVTVVSAKQEVIVSAGSLKSPAILELSGIGNKAVLEKFNISVKVDLPAVGENLQDQMTTNIAATAQNNITGTKTITHPNVNDVFGNETETVAKSVLANLKTYAAQTAKVNGGIMKAADLEKLFKIQYDLIFKDKVPIAEILFSPGGGASIAASYWGLLPFARGNVHIGSSNPAKQPVINPNFFMLEWDMQSQIAIAKFIRRTLETAPLKSLVQETSPGLSGVSRAGSDKEWKQWILDGNYRSNFHPVGTAAMMPREKGGVVDERLAVYGTSNVRVVDASVLPFQVCGHLTSTLYALSERAADFIKADSSA